MLADVLNLRLRKKTVSKSSVSRKNPDLNNSAKKISLAKLPSTPLKRPDSRKSKRRRKPADSAKKKTVSAERLRTTRELVRKKIESSEKSKLLTMKKPD